MGQNKTMKTTIQNLCFFSSDQTRARTCQAQVHAPCTTEQLSPRGRRVTFTLEGQHRLNGQDVLASAATNLPFPKPSLPGTSPAPLPFRHAELTRTQAAGMLEILFRRINERVREHQPTRSRDPRRGRSLDALERNGRCRTHVEGLGTNGGPHKYVLLRARAERRGTLENREGVSHSFSQSEVQ